MEFELCQDKKAWDRFVDSSAQGNVFCYSSFLDGLPEDYILAALTEAGEIVIGAILLVREGKVLRAPYPGTQYQGVLCGPDADKMPQHRRAPWLLDGFNLLIAELEKRYGGMSFCTSPFLNDLRAFQWFHYHEPPPGRMSIELRYSGIIDVPAAPDFEMYVAAIRADRRHDYQRALSRGFTVEQSTDIDLLDSLHEATFARQGIVRSALEQEIVKGIAAAAVAGGFGEVLVSKDPHGNAAGATLFLYDRRFGYYYIGANDPAYRKAGTGTLLVIESIRRCSERGLGAVDAVGVNSPNRGDFKTSLNARPVSFFVMHFGDTTAAE